MKTLTGVILDWTNEKTRELEESGEMNLKTGLKAAALGAIEGFVDSAVVMYPIMLGAAYYWKNQAMKNK